MGVLLRVPECKDWFSMLFLRSYICICCSVADEHIVRDPNVRISKRHQRHKVQCYSGPRLSSLRDISRAMDIERQRRREEAEREAIEEALRSHRMTERVTALGHASSIMILVSLVQPESFRSRRPCGIAFHFSPQFVSGDVFVVLNLAGASVKGWMFWHKRSKDCGRWGTRRENKGKLHARPLRKPCRHKAAMSLLGSDCIGCLFGQIDSQLYVSWLHTKKSEGSFSF